jgi:hypothetical protein
MSSISTTARNFDKHQNLAAAEAKVNTSSQDYNSFVADLIAILIIQLHVKEKKKDILNWLSSRNSSSRHENFSKMRESDSGTWLVESLEFKEWVSGSSQVLIGSGNGIQLRIPH